MEGGSAAIRGDRLADKSGELSALVAPSAVCGCRVDREGQLRAGDPWRETGRRTVAEADREPDRVSSGPALAEIDGWRAGVETAGYSGSPAEESSGESATVESAP